MSSVALRVDISHNEHLMPVVVLSVVDDLDESLVDPVVLDYQAVQELVAVLVDYMIEVDLDDENQGLQYR